MGMLYRGELSGRVAHQWKDHDVGTKSGRGNKNSDNNVSGMKE